MTKVTKGDGAVFVTKNRELYNFCPVPKLSPKTEEIFMPFVCGTATQFMAYYMARCLGNDVDKPRNLAKSVTVE